MGSEMCIRDSHDAEFGDGDDLAALRAVALRHEGRRHPGHDHRRYLSGGAPFHCAEPDCYGAHDCSSGNRTMAAGLDVLTGGPFLSHLRSLTGYDEPETFGSSTFEVDFIYFEVGPSGKWLESAISMVFPW